MGFKYRKVTFTIGDANFPEISTSSDVLLREQTAVRSVAEAIISMGIGWTLDSRCSSTSDFKPIPDAYYGSDRNTALFLINTNSGCKLFLGYSLGNGAKGLNISDDCICKTFNYEYSSQNGAVAGLLMSIIPRDSQSVFGTTALDLIPSDATRVVGTITTSYSSSTNLITIANKTDSAGTRYSYGVCATDSVVGILIKNWGRCFCGKILAAVANDSDTTPQSHYGTFAQKVVKDSSEFVQDWPNSTSGDTYYNISGSSDTTNGIGSLIFRYWEDYNFGYKAGYNCGGNSCCDENGSWISNTLHTGVCAKFDKTLGFSDMIYDYSNGRIAWSSLYFIVISNNIATYGVANGCGIKGVLDPNLFRAAKCTAYQTYGNGMFVGLYENMLLGWDPSNDSLT